MDKENIIRAIYDLGKSRDFPVLNISTHPFDLNSTEVLKQLLDKIIDEKKFYYAEFGFYKGEQICVISEGIVSQISALETDLSKIVNASVDKGFPAQYKKHLYRNTVYNKKETEKYYRALEKGTKLSLNIMDSLKRSLILFDMEYNKKLLQ